MNYRIWCKQFSILSRPYLRREDHSISSSVNVSQSTHYPQFTHFIIAYSFHHLLTLSLPYILHAIFFTFIFSIPFLTESRFNTQPNRYLRLFLSFFPLLFRIMCPKPYVNQNSFSPAYIHTHTNKLEQNFHSNMLQQLKV